LSIKPGNDATLYTERYQKAFSELGLAENGQMTKAGMEFLAYVEETASDHDKRLKEQCAKPVKWTPNYAVCDIGD
jgi:hypothetical protein